MTTHVTSSAIEALPPRGPAYRWNPDQQIIGYRERARIEPVRVVARGPQTRPLPVSVRGISPRWMWNGQAMDVDRYMAEARVSGVVVLKDREILLECYGLGRTEKHRWDSQSVTKSVTAILVGAAILDGSIRCMDDLVVGYLPELRGSAYEGVTVRHLLTMSSGVKFDGDYVNADGDGSRLWAEPFVNGLDPMLAYMRRQPRVEAPGARFAYKDADTDLAGLLVSRAVGTSLSHYLSCKLWQPYGMEKDAYWMVNPAGNERANCGLIVALRDFARIGQFMVEGGKAAGQHVVSPEWLKQATSEQIPLPPGSPREGLTGYGYFWWTGGEYYAALGHSGQGIFVHPRERVVIAVNSVWPEPNTDAHRQAMGAFIHALIEAAA